MSACAAPNVPLDAGIESGSDGDAGLPDGIAFRVLSVNVGNLDEVRGGPCPSYPYIGALCSSSQEAILAERIAEIRPDIAVINEVVDARRCTEDTWAGDPNHICTGAPEREPYQQARRLMGEGYTISCDDIQHFDCVAVRTERVTMEGCAEGEQCIDGSETPAHPEACATIGGHTSVSRVIARVDGVELVIVIAHPKNAISADQDPCRLAQYQQIFEQLVDGRPALLAGDFNMDPYRYPELFPSSVYWHTQVGAAQRFTAHNVVLPQPTPTFLGVATIDYVLSDFAVGGCQVLGESADTTRIDAPADTMDHRAVVCDLVWPTTPAPRP